MPENIDKYRGEEGLIRFCEDFMEQNCKLTLYQKKLIELLLKNPENIKVQWSRRLK